MSLPVYLPYSLGFLWLWSGIQPLVSASEASLTLLADVGVPLEGRWAVLMMASAWDVLLGILCFSKLRYRASLWLVQLGTVAIYSLIIAFALPENWLHPFAPLMKNVPIMALMCFLWQSNVKE